MSEHDKAYYRRRADAEISMACIAPSRQVAAVHQELAKAYLARVAQHAEVSTESEDAHQPHPRFARRALANGNG